jgi:hypothetical protein
MIRTIGPFFLRSLNMKVFCNWWCSWIEQVVKHDTICVKINNEMWALTSLAPKVVSQRDPLSPPRCSILLCTCLLVGRLLMLKTKGTTMVYSCLAARLWHESTRGVGRTVAWKRNSVERNGTVVTRCMWLAALYWALSVEEVKGPIKNDMNGPGWSFLG